MRYSRQRTTVDLCVHGFKRSSLRYVEVEVEVARVVLPLPGSKKYSSVLCGAIGWMEVWRSMHKVGGCHTLERALRCVAFSGFQAVD